jgi:hypothetical protein
MELPDEILKLLCEIRDNQRKLLTFSQEWKAESDRRYREWERHHEEERKEFEADRAKWEEGNTVWKKANEEWLRGSKNAGLVLFFIIMFIGVLGIGWALINLGWIN